MTRSLLVLLVGLAVATIMGIVVLSTPSDTVASWALIVGLSALALLTVILSNQADRDRS